MILDDDFEITVFDPNYHEQDQMFDQKPEFSTIMGKLYKQRGTVFETLKKKSIQNFTYLVCHNPFSIGSNFQTEPRKSLIIYYN